jgi:uncharacterized protein (DUF58 family)
LGDTDDVLSSIYRLSGHELVVIQLLAPQETDMPFGGDIKFVDLESNLPLITRITEQERQEYLRRISEHNDRIRAACSQVGADYFLVRVDRPIFEAFSEMLSRTVIRKT